MAKRKNIEKLELLSLDRDINESIGDYAVRCLEYNIVTMNIKPGVFISEQAVSNELKISRTPIREAFYRLEKSGFIEIYPQVGTMISLIDINLIDETSFMRMVLEKEIVKIVIENFTDSYYDKIKKNIDSYSKNIKSNNPYKLLEIDNKFHEMLFKIANKINVYNWLKDYIKHFNRARVFNILEMDRNRTLLEHRELLDSIKNKDVKKSMNIIEHHLTNVHNDLLFLKDKFPDYFKK